MTTRPEDVSLIIFDMDGTIIPSLETIYRGIQRVFADYGWELRHSIGEVNSYVGTASGELYRAIIPPEHTDRWEELRDRIRREYAALFRKGAETYPNVRKTLETLRRRGYRLVQYSNASVLYFDTVLGSLGIRDCYDYTECVHEHGLTKTELIRKIREKFGNPGTAVVGDRIHDIEGAVKNGCLAIGAVYGYGGEEPYQADVTIETFEDLVDVFDRRAPVFERILHEIRRRKSPERAFVVGINGIDCSGKTNFANGLDKHLRQQGYRAQLIHLDEFLNPREVRYSGDARDDLYYERFKEGFNYNYPLLIDNVLGPAQRYGQVKTRLSLLDWRADRFDIEREYAITRDTIVIVEGIFLFIKNIAPYIDLQVFLDAPFGVCLERARERDPEHVYVNYETKYRPAQRKYLTEYPPDRYADIIIDNTDPEKPRIA